MLVFNAQPGQEGKRKIVIKADVPFSITKIESSDQSIEVVSNDESKKVHIVDAILRAPDDPGEYPGEIIITTDLSGGTSQNMKTTITVSVQ